MEMENQNIGFTPDTKGIVFHFVNRKNNLFLFSFIVVYKKTNNIRVLSIGISIGSHKKNNTQS